MISHRLHQGPTQGAGTECTVDLDADPELGAFISINAWPFESESVPRALHLNVAQSRAVGQALLAAADKAEAILPARCSCGDPIAQPGQLCLACNSTIAKNRRATLRIVS